MKNIFLTTVMVLLGSLGYAGNAGGGGSGKTNGQAVVYFQNIDEADVVQFKLGVYRNDKITSIYQEFMPMKGIDPKYVDALKESFETGDWAAVK